MILSGPSAVGKDTLIAAWSALDPRVVRVVTYTTRPPRRGEVDGVEYHFVTTSRFRELADSGQFLEYKKVHGNWYASPKTDTDQLVSSGKIAVLKIDVEGALEVMRQRTGALTVFVDPPSEAELELRIRRRGADSEEEIQRRLAAARTEMAKAGHYQHRIVNDSVERAARELGMILEGGQ